MKSQRLPIGYWIKRADELLTKEIDEIQSSFELTRTDWQVLNSIFERGQTDKSELTTLMKPFADLDLLNTILIKFKEDNLLREGTEQLTLTDKGIELHKACFEKQKAFRQKAMADISEQQYQETILTLQKIINNLS